MAYSAGFENQARRKFHAGSNPAPTAEPIVDKKSHLFHNTHHMTPEAQELKLKIRDFAGLQDFKARRTLFPGLRAYIMEPKIDGAIASLSESWPRAQSLLAVAAKLAVECEVKIEENSMLSWVGGYTVVLLSKEGDIAAVSNPLGKVYEEYGANLTRPALRKALDRMYLDLDHGDGLDELKDFEAIERLGFKRNKDIFLGEAIVDVNENRFYIGASGCELRDEYLQELLPPNMIHHLREIGELYRFRELFSVDFLAGAGDAMFASWTAHFLVHPWSPAKSLSEHRLLSTFRNLH